MNASQGTTHRVGAGKLHASTVIIILLCLSMHAASAIEGDGCSYSLDCSLPKEKGGYNNIDCGGQTIDVSVTESNEACESIYPAKKNKFTYTIKYCIPPCATPGEYVAEFSYNPRATLKFEVLPLDPTTELTLPPTTIRSKIQIPPFMLPTETCDKVCVNKGFESGLCDSNPLKCSQRKQTYEPDALCPKTQDKNYCCCKVKQTSCNEYCVQAGHLNGVCGESKGFCSENDLIYLGDKCGETPEKPSCCCTPRQETTQTTLQAKLSTLPVKIESTTTIKTLTTTTRTTVKKPDTTVKKTPEKKQLTINAPSYAVKGSDVEVKVAYDGSPIKAKVTMTRPDGTKEAMDTDQSGVAVFAVMTTGRVHFTAEKNDYIPDSTAINVVDLSEILFHPYSLLGLLLSSVASVIAVWLYYRRTKIVVSQKVLATSDVDQLVDINQRLVYDLLEGNKLTICVTRNAYDRMGLKYMDSEIQAYLKRVKPLTLKYKDNERVESLVEQYELDKENAEAIVLAEKIRAKELVVLEKDVERVTEIISPKILVRTPEGDQSATL
ncbi:MAG: hypothetical protein ABIH11_06910 [Candidatus Altiarchaeota archaeon]